MASFGSEGQRTKDNGQTPLGDILASTVGVATAAPTAQAMMYADGRPVVERVEIECVIGGALQRVALVGLSPEKTLAYLKTLDPNVKVREDFPSKFSGGGNRDTKLGRLLSIQVRSTDSGLFWSLVASGPDGDVPVEVSKKQAGAFLDAIKGVGKLDDGNVTKLADAIANKKQAVVMVLPPVEMGVKYWSTDDGKHFVDSLTADVPEAK